MNTKLRGKLSVNTSKNQEAEKKRRLRGQKQVKRELAIKIQVFWHNYMICIR